MEKRKYLVIHESKHDMFIEEYEKAKEATEEARKTWEHLTYFEQKKEHVYSCYVTKKDLLEDAIDEKGNIDWKAFAGTNYYRGCFDSNKIK